MSNQESKGVALLRKPRPPKRIVQFEERAPTEEYFEDTSPRHNPRWNTAEVCYSREPFVHSLHPKGPPFFRPSLRSTLAPPIPRILTYTLPDELLFLSIKEIQKKDKFILNTFLLPTKLQPPPRIKAGSVSKHNYEKLTSWFARHVPGQEELNTSLLELDAAPPPVRVPKKQVMIELQRLMTKLLYIDNTSSPDGQVGAEVAANMSCQPPQWEGPQPNDVLFRTCVTEYFCGQGRSTSPFHEEGQPHCTAAEVGILESMFAGGHQLILKALFIDRLPPLSPLANTLTYLNLSFNCFNDFPQALLELRSLGFLSMRNNPIRSIPNGIRRLRNLCILCLSFCILSDLPAGLYDLHNLADLDISYNNLTQLSRDICKLTNLHRLNVEGNQLPGLPCTMLSIKPSHILLGNNLMQPIFWKHNIKNRPQALSDLCSSVVSKNTTDLESLQQSQFAPLTGILERSVSGKCDLCHEPIFGPGLSVIRGVEHKHYAIKNLPFIFKVCSSECSSELRKRPDKYWLHPSSVT